MKILRYCIEVVDGEVALAMGTPLIKLNPQLINISERADLVRHKRPLPKLGSQRRRLYDVLPFGSFSRSDVVPLWERLGYENNKSLDNILYHLHNTLGVLKFDTSTKLYEKMGDT